MRPACPPRGVLACRVPARLCVNGNSTRGRDVAVDGHRLTYVPNSAADAFFPALQNAPWWPGPGRPRRRPLLGLGPPPPRQGAGYVGYGCLRLQARSGVDWTGGGCHPAPPLRLCVGAASCRAAPAWKLGHNGHLFRGMARAGRGMARPELLGLRPGAMLERH